ncbi:AAA family ATPase [Carboxylicivirga sediminis]|uniref:AAA family ATPase n=1 Tax=Carboxylicivirga sediminis TaxID=2006564 RepID=A0A941F1H7_9BACT|nr:AAA family ATPase [Carboxylicivirga sediminis]MBR8535113.1 AAA family ATPase [Carboxylicivirga sediminis]
MSKVKHISARLAWHADGWNGKICRNPLSNTYCTGQYSFPGGLYEKKSEQVKEAEKFAGCSCNSIQKEYIPPCSWSINAFGDETVKAETKSPNWYTNQETKQWALPPATVSLWSYEEMYHDDDKNDDGTFNYEKRMSNAKAFIKEIQENSSLIFYYANYSNPLSVEDEKRYTIVGFGRVKKVHDLIMYDKTTVEEKQRYAGAYVWQVPIQSNYPEEGFRIPYHKYKDNPEILEKIAFYPENARNFKYAMRHVSDDDALELVERALEIVDVLEYEIKDTTEDWSLRRKWLQSLLAELWKNRGCYPGLPAVLNYLDLPELVSHYKEGVLNNTEEENYKQILDLLLKQETIPSVVVDSERLTDVQDNFATMEDEEIEYLLQILPRFAFEQTKRLKQISQLCSVNRANNGLEFTFKELVDNPYLICENYIGNDVDDHISLSKIDHGMLPSPDLGLKPMTSKGSAYRFRAFCIDQLKRIAPHTFTAAEIILQKTNKYISHLSEWRQFEFKMKNFTSYKEVLDNAIFQRKDKSDNLHLYQKNIFEDERLIEENCRLLANREITQFKSPVTERNWFDYLYVSSSNLSKLNPDDYKEAVTAQAKVCQKIFGKGLSVISGGAGTGKTTVVKSIISGIEKAHGVGTSFLLLAPTGKAADRLRERSGKSAQTIHSFLAERGWMNDNFTYKRNGGKQEENVRIFIIDESSMIDQSLMATMFRAINWNTVQRIIFVGDPNQLPPIGYAKVFSDLIDWLPEENKGELKENLRQRENKLEGRGTGILDLASTFKQSVCVDEDLKDTAEVKAKRTDLLKKIQELEFDNDLKDIDVHFWDNEEELNELIFSTLIKNLELETGIEYNEEKYWELLNKVFENSDSPNGKKADKFQVISPYRSELFGTDALNVFLQRKLNRNCVERQWFVDGISVFDKIIQFRNRTKSDPILAYVTKEKATIPIQIYNGELGFTRWHNNDKKAIKDEATNTWYNPRYKAPFFRLEHFIVNLEGRDAHIPFGKKLGKYKNTKGYWNELKEEKPENNLELAYAISVHKSQGSEFDEVYLILPKNKKALLSKELIYTAITRAKTKLTVFAEQDIGAFLQLTRPEANKLSKINSSLFEFNPLPKEWLIMNDWYEVGKIHETLSEYMVRSKSEVIIANMLTERNIPFWYEKPLFATDGTFYLPDFTVMLAGEEYYLEHVGRLDLPNYKAHWEEKELWYKKHFPNKLLTTYESGSLSNDIDRIIKELQ